MASQAFTTHGVWEIKNRRKKEHNRQKYSHTSSNNSFSIEISINASKVGIKSRCSEPNDCSIIERAREKNGKAPSTSA